MTLSGTYTALVTPFNQDGSVDYGALEELVKWQIIEGVEGVVPVGTTGESPTLSFDENIRVVAFVAECAAGKIKVIAGTGANSTAEAIHLTSDVLHTGVNATLQVTPYYNRPTAEGLYQHFAAIADLGLPVILYNVPGRTSREIPIDVVVRLSAHEKVVAIKEAGGSVDRVSAIINACALTVLSGDDALALPMISVGATGVISVASNIIPQPMSTLIRLALDGNIHGARELHRVYYPLFRDLFIETNPIPIKTALAMLGRITPGFRLPLCEMSEPTRQQLLHTMRNLDLL